MDGDPSKSLGLIAHPGEVSSLAISYDGRRLVTSGECALHSLHSLLSVHYTHSSLVVSVHYVYDTESVDNLKSLGLIALLGKVGSLVISYDGCRLATNS